MRWVAWRRETRDGKLVKVPYNPRTGDRAQCNNSGTWATRSEAEWWTATEHGDGVGIVLGPVGDVVLCGIDLDSCVDAGSGEVAGWAQEVIDRIDSYCETSPSGGGIKIFVRVPQAEQAALDAIFGGQSGKQFKRGNAGDHPPAIEIYRGRRYFAVTGDSISDDHDLRVVSLEDLRWLLTAAGPKFAGETKGECNPNGKDESRSARAFRAGAELKAAGATYDEMRSALLESKDPEVAQWARTKGLANDERELRRIFDKVGDDGPAVRLEDFVAYMQSHAYIFMPSGDFWPGGRVDARLPPVKLVARNGQPILDPRQKNKSKCLPAPGSLRERR